MKYAAVAFVALASISPMFVYASTRPSTDAISFSSGYTSSYCGSLANGRSACRHGHTFVVREPRVHTNRDVKLTKVPLQPPHAVMPIASIFANR